MCVCVCVCVYICIDIYACVCVCVYVYIYIYIYICVCVYIYNIGLYLCVCVCIYIYIYIYLCVYIYLEEELFALIRNKQVYVVSVINQALYRNTSKTLKYWFTELCLLYVFVLLKKYRHKYRYVYSTQPSMDLLILNTRMIFIDIFCSK